MSRIQHVQRWLLHFKPRRLTRIHIANIAGAVGYNATLLIWLLVINVLLLLLPPTVDTTPSLGHFLMPDLTETTTTSAVYEPHVITRMMMSILLLGLMWIFGYFVARVMSATLRFFFAKAHRTVTLKLLTEAKYLIAAVGLIGLAILSQFMPQRLAGVEVILTIMGMIGGIVAVGGALLQRVLAERFKVAVSHLL